MINKRKLNTIYNIYKIFAHTTTKIHPTKIRFKHFNQILEECPTALLGQCPPLTALRSRPPLPRRLRLFLLGGAYWSRGIMTPRQPSTYRILSEGCCPGPSPGYNYTTRNPFYFRQLLLFLFKILGQLVSHSAS